jgi:16S rRNA (adenine1518-N6/adenine1519-N6)-dimethyltransferase
MSPRRAPGAVRRAAGAGGGRRGATSGRTRALGQHFLRDSTVAQRLVALVAPGPRDLVVEIGPGDGALTGLLARSGARLRAVEIDATLASRLRERFAGMPGVEIVEADARRRDWAALGGDRPDPAGRVIAVGNLPYSAGTVILQSLVAAGPALDEMALMLQREVAERVAAAPGHRTYGSLSVLVQMACEVRLAFAVPAGAFRPAPRVESAVLHLRVRPAPAVAVTDTVRFERVVHAAFAQRRKTLANALAAGLALAAPAARELLIAAGIDPMRRAETVSLTEFARLASSYTGGAPPRLFESIANKPGDESELFGDLGA